METKSIKFLAFCAAICIAVGTASGCSKSAGSKDNDTIVWYMRKPVDNMSSMNVVMDEANKKIKEKIGAKLEFRFIESGSYAEKLNVLCTSGDEFDICTLGDGSAMKRYAEDGAFLALDDLIKQYGHDITEQQDTVLGNYGKYNGKIYCITGQGAYSVARSFVFKKDLVDKYKFDYKSVKSLKDLEPYFSTIKENEPGIIPMHSGVTDVVNENYTESGVDGVVFDENSEEFVIKYDYPAIIEEARTKNDFYKKGYIASDAISRTDEMSEKKSGQYAVMGNNGYYSENGSKSSSVYGFPCVETYAGNTIATLHSQTSNCISATSKHPEKAMQLLDLIWKDKDLLNLLAYGVEGVNYTVNEERTKEIGSKSINVKTGSEQTWAIWHNWLGPLFNQWDSSWNTVEVLNNIDKNNKSAKVSKLVGFSFDTEPVKASVAKVSATYKAAYRVFDIGCMDDFDKYLQNTHDEMKNSGVDDVISELTNQYKKCKNK